MRPRSSYEHPRKGALGATERWNEKELVKQFGELISTPTLCLAMAGTVTLRIAQ